MTELYSWNPMPHKVDVVCPECSGHAVFEFAEIAKIALKKDVDYFKKSKCFDYQQFTDSCGHKWHGAIFYHGLHSTNEIKNLPEAYAVDNFKHNKYCYRSHGLDIGAKYCTACGTKRKSQLHWPADAYYQCDIKGHVLWAFNKESLVELRDFICSSKRDVKAHKYQTFLRHIPSVFLDRKNRELVVKKLDRILE